MASVAVTTTTSDVAIIGGGVIGSAIACFLKGEMGFPGRVVVIERDPTYARCATTRSAGGIRQQFSIAENVRMSLFGIEFLRAAQTRLAVDGEAPDLGLRENGYLFLASAGGADQLRANHELQIGCGARVDLLDRDGMARRFPWLALEGIAAGAFGIDEGWFDPNALLQAFRHKARAHGVEFIADDVVGLTRAATRINRVILASGAVLAPGIVVNAAGAAAGAVARLAGIELPVGPRKRQVFVFACRERIAAPLTIDPTGVWFRPEGAHYIAGVSPDEAHDPETWDDAIDHREFDDVVWPALATRVPAFEAIKPINAWIGHYDYNALDQNAILGPHPAIANFIFANGFSGHGLQQSPAAGRAIAELIVHGGYRSLDLSAFSFARVLANRPYREANVV